MDWSILLPYVIGTVMGLYFGFKRGIRMGANLTVIQLCAAGYLKYTGNPAQDVELYKFDEEIPNPSEEQS